MKITKKDKRTKLEKEIDSVLEEMNYTNPKTEAYTAMATNLETLYKAKANEKVFKVSPDTIVIAVVSLIQIGLIIGHEKTDIITSKALGYVFKGRV